MIQRAHGLGKTLRRCFASWRRGAIAAGLCALPASAPCDDVQSWTVAGVRHRLEGGAVLQGSVRLRLDRDVARTKDLLLRVGLSHKLSPRLNLALGYDQLEAVEANGEERRPWQSLEVTHRIDAVELRGRLRVDERFRNDASGLIWRLRGRLGVRVPLPRGWKTFVWNEFWWNANNRHAGPPHGFEQNRLGIAFERRITDQLALSAAYQWVTKLARNGTHATDHVIELRLVWATRSR